MKRKYLIVSLLGVLIVVFGVGVSFMNKTSTEQDIEDSSSINLDSDKSKISDEYVLDDLKVDSLNVSEENNTTNISLSISNTSTEKEEDTSVTITFYDTDGNIVDSIDMVISSLDVDETKEWFISTDKDLTDAYSYSVTYENDSD